MKNKLQTQEFPPTLNLIIFFIALVIGYFIPIVCDVLKAQREKENLKQTISHNAISEASTFFYSRMDNMENPRKLTVERIRRDERFANISEEEAKEIIDGLYKLSIISYNIFNYGTRKL